MYLPCRLHLAGILVAGLLLTSTSALALQCGQNRQSPGREVVRVQLPANLAVPVDAPDDTVIWESPVQRIQGVCWDGRFLDKLNFWLNPGRAPSPPGLVVSLRYNNVTMAASTAGAGAVMPTGIDVGTTDRAFDLSYSIVLTRKGVAPASGITAIANLDVFQLDGAFGLNINPAMKTLRQQISGSVRFSARATCMLTAGSGNQSVRLPEIRSSALSQPGSTGGRVNFTLNLVGCSQSVRSARFTFEGERAPGAGRYFNNTGSADGVALRIGQQGSGGTITPTPNGNETTVNVVNGEARLPLFAEYVRVAAVVPGTLRSRATVSVSYP